MKILFLTQILPYPPTSGPKVKTWHVLRYLSQMGHRITLASFVRPEELPYLDAVKQICADVHAVLVKRSRVADVGYLLRSQISGRPFLVERDDLSEMRTLVDRIVRTELVDVIHADQLTMTQFALPYAGSPDRKPALIFDAHNAVWTITGRMKDNLPFYFRLPVALETRRIKQYEGRIVREFDATLAVTEPDLHALTKAAGTGLSGKLPISVVPIAVDTRELCPVARQEDSLNILTMGTLYYPPNADGIRWFVKEVFPHIRDKVPGAQLTIIGKNPPGDFLKLAEDENNGIAVTGFVPDLDPYFAKSALTVVPVRAGGGMRVRILEAFARAMPVVTTTVGLEGIQAQPGRDVLVEDMPIAFADAVVKLLKDKSLQDQLSVNGRRLAEEKYDWQVILNEMNKVYEQFK